MHQIKDRYVKHFRLTVDNLIDTLFYASEKSCLFQKKQQQGSFLKTGKQILASYSFESSITGNNLLAVMKKRAGPKRNMKI